MLHGPWQLQLLGRMRAVNADRQIERFRTEKTASLLAYLALGLGRSFTREELFELIWPDADLDRGRMSLRTALSSLRRQFEPPGVPAGSVIVADVNAVSLNPEFVRTDAAEFERLIASAAGGRAEVDRAADYSAAVELYRGELLSGLFDEWIAPVRERFAASWIKALRFLVRHYAAQKELPFALKYAQLAANALPANEEVQRDLIRLYLAMGHPSLALRQLAEVEEILRDEEGRGLSEATKLLAAEADQAAGSDGRKAHSTINTQPQVRRCTTNSVPTHQTAATSRLPMRFNRFFGRESEIERLCDLILADDFSRGAPRLLTLTGPGGTGKTRLALELSHHISRTGQLTVCFVPLEDLLDARLIPMAIAEALEIALDSSVSPLDQVVAALSGRRVLLVLDNFEQLVAQGAGTVLALISRLPELQILTTSRRRLELPAEREIPLAPLAIPGQQSDLESLIRVPSVQLFIDRAQAARPDFQLTPGNSQAVAELCARLEGMPLAIELAAARSQTLTVVQMLKGLDERFHLLAGIRADKVSRHRSLWAAIDWSYSLLTPELQRFFRSLSAFRGGWSGEAAAEVCTERRSLEFLTQLRSHSLIVAEDAEDEMRFRMLDSIRAYADERLADDERERLYAAHAEYVRALCEESEAGLVGERQTEYFARLEREHDNIRAALQRSLDSGNVETAARTGAAIWRFWWVRGHVEEGMRWLEAAIYTGNGSLEAAILARAHHGAGTLGWASKQLDMAERHHREALALRRDLGDLDGAARSLGSLGNVLRERRDDPGAQVCYKESLELFRKVGDKRMIATSLLNLGTIAEDELDDASARSYYQESLELYRETGDQNSIGIALFNLANILCNDGDLDHAMAYFRECMHIRKELGSKSGICFLLGATAKYYVCAGMPETAVTLLSASENLLDQLRHESFATFHYACDSSRQTARAQLADEAFTRADEAGKHFTLDEAIALAFPLA